MLEWVKKVWALIVEDDIFSISLVNSVLEGEDVESIEVCKYLECAKEKLPGILENNSHVIIYLDGQFPDTEETLNKWFEELEANKWNNWEEFLNYLFSLLPSLNTQVLLLANSRNAEHNKMVKKLVTKEWIDNLTCEITNKAPYAIIDRTKEFVNEALKSDV